MQKKRQGLYIRPIIKGVVGMREISEKTIKTINLNNLDEELEKAYAQYDAKFGNGASNKIAPLVDPVHPYDVATIKAILNLREAIMSGKSLPEWDVPENILYLRKIRVLITLLLIQKEFPGRLKNTTKGNRYE